MNQHDLLKMATTKYCILISVFVTLSNKHVGALQGPCSIDAAFTWNGDQKLYLLKNEYYMRWEDGFIGKANEWNIPSNVDAALTMDSRKDINYIFKGCSVWTVYQNAKSRTLGPFHMAQIFRGIPCDLDAATMVSGKIVFFKGNRCWVWHEKHALALEGGINMWPSIEGDIDAALQWDGKTYFLKGKTYWRFDADVNTTAMGETTVGWPQLINGPLLPLCACDCTNCCHSNWEFYNIAYFKSKATSTSPQPETIDQHIVDNRNASVAPTIGFVVSKNVTESELFLNSQAETLELGRIFKCAIPLLHNGIVSKSLSAPYAHFWGKEIVKDRMETVKYVSPTVAGKKITFTTTLHAVQVEIPFTITMKYRFRQCSCEINGILKVERMDQIKMSVIEEV